MISALIISAIISYLLGSLNFGIIISKSLNKDDVRSHGSGNAGSTNMLSLHRNARHLILGMSRLKILQVIKRFMQIGKMRTHMNLLHLQMAQQQLNAPYAAIALL